MNWWLLLIPGAALAVLIAARAIGKAIDVLSKR